MKLSDREEEALGALLRVTAGDPEILERVCQKYRAQHLSGDMPTQDWVDVLHVMLLTLHLNTGR